MGFDIDARPKEAAKRLGLEVTKPIDWSIKEARLSGKRVDALWTT